MDVHSNTYGPRCRGWQGYNLCSHEEDACTDKLHQAEVRCMPCQGLLLRSDLMRSQELLTHS